MRCIILLFTAFITLSSCKKEKEFENAFVGNWRMDSVVYNTNGISTYNTTNSEIVTSFESNSKKFQFQSSGTKGAGTYELGVKNKITITVQRGDFGGWPNGPWVDLYLETMNKAKEYEVNETRLFIITNDNRKIFFTKL